MATQEQKRRWAKVTRHRYPDRYQLKQRRKYLKLVHNITLEQYNRMVERQNNKCAICGTGPSKIKGWNIDHDHKTGRIRGLLCYFCNYRLVTRWHTIDKLQRAVEYLKDNFDGRVII